MPTIFTQIAEGKLPAYRVAETDDYLAFLDIRPLTRGHTLVIPKREVDYLLDLEEPLYVGLWLFAKEVARAIHMAIPCERVAFAVVGLEVPHAHIHLVPIRSISDLNFQNPRIELSPQEFQATAEAIQAKLRELHPQKTSS
ncbi:MAG: HIT family protein [Bacteroidia bacterium]|nr:HIT family protein [Bacteroidia bacterium]MCX7652920.1 HIT family protein [Bacteroidia bacterium]MDW8416612.1 HIT family protein [Bacteroidia bacterium]